MKSTDVRFGCRCLGAEQNFWNKLQGDAAESCVPAERRSQMRLIAWCSVREIGAHQAGENKVPDFSSEAGHQEQPASKLQNETLGDFTTTPRVIPISALAMVIGLICAFVALALLRLIGLFTNLFYFGRWSTSLVSPAGNHLGLYSVLAPVAGALIIGVMARYGI